MIELSKSDILRNMRVGDKYESTDRGRSLVVLACLIGRDTGRKYHTMRTEKGFTIWRLL